jgi:dolichol-phosphate mannosyltransferase
MASTSLSHAAAPHLLEPFHRSPATVHDQLQRIAVVIPCFNVSRFIMGVIERIGSEVHSIYVIDDQCPERSGHLVASTCKDERVRVFFHNTNQGVGGATLTGYALAIEDGADLIVKLDGDGQMDPTLIRRFAKPILRGQTDYTKGNRFYCLQYLQGMPALRLLGNAGLSFLAKLSSGYWTVMDPTNGYTCIHSKVAKQLLQSEISKRYFFESDMLFHLNLARAAVQDIPMAATYGDETSGLKILKILPEFAAKHGRNFIRRLFYTYLLRDFSIGTLEGAFGALLMGTGATFGTWHWCHSMRLGVPASSGTVMLAALPLILGFQLLLAALAYDIQSVPKGAVHREL